MSDQQTRFDAFGAAHRYSEVAIQIQKPDGLSVGNVAFAWRPDMDDVTVHDLKILRGNRIIDVFATGKTFTVLRRETDLEAAQLDGMLTATMQVEGVELGDVILFASSVITHDKVLGAHFEDVGAQWNGVAIERAHYRAEWPSNRPTQLRSAGALPHIKPAKTGDFQVFELTMNKVEPESMPEGAPARFRRGRFVEATSYSTWNDISAVMEPLYRKASVIPVAGPLREQLAKIKAGTTDPLKRTQQALNLVQDKVRYVAMQMGAGGLTPASASATWSSRYGDCKAKTALLLAMLHELGVPAVPVLVHSSDGDGLDARLPRVGLFDHVLVRAEVAGKTYWLDGTRNGDTDLATLITPDFRWGLPLLSTRTQLASIRPALPVQPTEERLIEVDARDGIYAPAPVRAEILYRGDIAKVTDAAVSAIAASIRDEMLRKFWKGRLDDVEPTTVAVSFDKVTGIQRFTMSGTIKVPWESGFWRLPWGATGYKADFSRPPGTNREAPFEVNYPQYVKVVERIQLPPGVKIWEGKGSPNVDQTLAGVEYKRSVSLRDGRLELTRSERSLRPEITFQEAQQAQAALRALDERDVFLKVGNYRATESDLKVKLTETPTNAQEYIDRGLLLLEADKLDESVADFGKAHDLDPKNAWALANRGLARAYKMETAAAKVDLAAARAIDPSNLVAMHGEAVLSAQEKDAIGAIDWLTKSLAQDPGDDWALSARAQLYWQEKDVAKALADTNALLKAGVDSSDLRLLRANIYRGQGRPDLAMAEAQALARGKPRDAFAQVAAAKIMAALDFRSEAMIAIDRALAIKPEAYIYLNRITIRTAADKAGRRDDIAAALKLDPTNVDVQLAQGDYLVSEGHLAEGIGYYDKAIAQSPDEPRLHLQRAIALARSKQLKAAATDFAIFRSSAKTGTQFNDLCWAEATAGVQLELALQDCNNALALEPENTAYNDSRALVYLRLGRLDEAVADYSVALLKGPKRAASLFGRALSWSRKGDKIKAASDLAEAVKVSPGVSQEFASYGLAMP